VSRIERRGECNRCGLCEIGCTEPTLVWTEGKVTGEAGACSRTDYANADGLVGVGYMTWPARLDQALEGCAFTFARIDDDLSEHRILGKRWDAVSGRWLYPDQAVVER